MSEQKNQEFADSKQVAYVENQPTASKLKKESDLGGGVTTAQTAGCRPQDRPFSSIYPKDDQPVYPESPFNERLEKQNDAKELSVSTNAGAAGVYEPSIIFRKKSFAQTSYGKFHVERKFGPSRYLGSSCSTNEIDVASTLLLDHNCAHNCE